MGSMVLTRRLLEKQSARLRDLECRILLLKPEFDAAKGPPGRPRKRHGPQTAGRQSRDVIQALRKAALPMSVAELCAVIALPPGKTNPIQRLQALLRYLASTGRVMKLGKGRSARWIVASVKQISAAA